ncbi:unnamed protein product [Urochloa decumbens]|uniref:Uncharacterized protein n=1 Tax=Urochloa decumbens TaxID=240449 RepID=A0ABC9DSR2_9POAL
MSKRRRQENRYHRCGGEKRLRGRKHLYVVLDDWIKGFTIYKVDADSFGSDSDNYRDRTGGAKVAAAASARHHLPEPPAARLESMGADTDMFFTALGSSKIFIVTDQRRGQTPALVYNACSGGLAIGPRVPAQLQCGFNFVVDAGEALYAFSSPRFNKDSSFQVMSWAPSALDQLDANSRYPNEEVWAWRALPGPPPPHDPYEIITSYAVHPDGHTIFMTTSYRDRPGLQKSTYSFNTKHCVWRWHAWTLPFQGPGHFDTELNVWVGLHKDGYVCACRVASDSGSATPMSIGLMQLDWQKLEAKLFRKDRERYIRASLTYMGSSKFCLLESVIRKGVDKDYSLNDQDGCVLHMTMFGLKYNHKGELRTTNLQSTRSYLVSKHKDYSFAPVAFWM